MSYIGFSNPITIFRLPIINKYKLNEFFIDLSLFFKVNNIEGGYLMIDKFYHKYLAREDVGKTYNLMKEIEVDFLNTVSSVNIAFYNKIFSSFYSVCNEFIEMDKSGILDDFYYSDPNICRIQIVSASNIVEMTMENKLKNETLDNIPRGVSPYWMRDCSIEDYLSENIH